ncbi:MAG: hypothetical protein AAGD40_10140, partial [Pseudomonadota bacterium]
EAEAEADQGEAEQPAYTDMPAEHGDERQDAPSYQMAPEPEATPDAEDASIATDEVSDAEAAGANRDWMAGQTPGTEILFPGPDHNPRAPAQRVVIKHMPGQSVDLTINGEAVSGYAFDGKDGGKAAGFAVSRWRGISLREGRNVIAARILGADGAPVETLSRDVWFVNTPARATLVPEKSRLIADGRERPIIAVRFTDGNGRPVRAGATSGFTVEAPYRAAFETDAQQARQLAGLEQYAPQWQVKGDDGIAYIALDPTQQTGSVRLNFPFQTRDSVFSQDLETWLQPGDQDFVLVGFAAGTVGFNTISDNAEALLDETQDETFTDGEVKLYGKGRILGKWLVTLAISSEREDRRGERRRLLDTIDPDRFYTIYGDGSEQRFDAPTSDRVYLRVERDQFYAMYGDFETGLTNTELARYSRTLTGVKGEYRSDGFALNAFAADTGLRFRRIEIQGNGLSGPYNLGVRDLVLNSDKVFIETRDRFRSDLIVNREQMQRHIDYDVDPVAGTLRFRRPILSRDANLNPVFIVADVETNGFAEQRFNGGGRGAAFLFGDRVELGASFIRDSDERAETDLYAADMRVKVRDDTEIRAEFAHTEAEIADFGQSDGEAWLVEARHHGGRVDLTAYARQQESGFGVGQQNDAETGTRKFGVDGSLKVAKGLIANVSAYREDFLVGPARRELLNAEANWTDGGTTLRGGYRTVNDRGRDGDIRESDLLTLGGAQAVLGGKLVLDGQAEIAVGGRDESVDYPSRYRGGITYQLSDSVRVVAAHEYAVGDTFEANNTEIGFDLAPWTGSKLTTSLNQQGIKEFGPRTFAAL